MKEKILSLLNEHPGLTQPQAAALLGVSKQRVYQVCKKHGIVLAKAKRGAPTRSHPKPRFGIDTGKISHTAAGTVSELLVAADLTARGWHVFFPLVRTTRCDLIILSKDGLDVRRIEVRSGRRIEGNVVQYAKKGDAACDHHAVVLKDEPVIYKPPLPE